jgi:hypothetical protein
MPEVPAATATAAPVATEAAAPALDLSALCPAETEDTTLYVSAENGFCALYPSSLTLREDSIRPEEVIHLTGAPANPTAMESVAVDLGVAYNGPADGLDSAQYAETWLALNMPGMTAPQEAAAIGGQPAVIMSTQTGMFPQRSAFVVANGVKYQITVQPQPEVVPKLAEEATLAWDTVTRSIVFFPPQNTRTVVRPADVCPTETPDSKLALNLIYGYCFLYPADFAPDPEFPITIKGATDLGDFEGFENVRVSLTVAGYPLGAISPDEALQPPSEQIDAASVTQTTIGGHPAVLFDFTGGPWRQCNAQILVGDAVYTFVGQPWDAELFPQALPDVERLWTMASETIAFFDLWR